MGIIFSVGDADTREERGVLERRRQAVPASSGSRSRGDVPPAGWVLDQRWAADDDERATTWAW